MAFDDLFFIFWKRLCKSQLICISPHTGRRVTTSRLDYYCCRVYFFIFGWARYKGNFFNLMNLGLVSHFGCGAAGRRGTWGHWERARLPPASLGEDKGPNGVESGFVIFLEAPLNPGICHKRSLLAGRCGGWRPRARDEFTLTWPVWS